MRVNITVACDVVEEIDAGEHSVDLADFQAAGLGPRDIAETLVSAIQEKAAKARAPRAAAKERPASAASGTDYPLDPEQD